MNRRPLWFTTPPIPYPYILLNANKPKISSVLRFRKEVKAIILDSGIEIFRNPKVKDYPKGHIWKIVALHNKLKRLFPHAKVWATIPDYCDDYYPRNLWISEEVRNIERTVENVFTWTEKLDYVNWLIPIQGWNRKPTSLERCIKLLNQGGVLNQYDYFAVGNLCIETDTKIIHKTAHVARKLLPDKRLHIFGIKLRAIPLVHAYIDSFDSLAWTRPVDSSLPEKWSCKNQEERIKFFKAWYNRLSNYLAQLPLDFYMV